MTLSAAPLGGKILTRPYLALLAVAAIGFVVILWRLLVGLGPTTALNDGYPWGLWIAFEVVTGTALACGGYAVAILCYILNKGRYHPLVRPAILTSALGYTIAGLSIALDVGRYWILYRVFMPFKYDWNFNSVLLEVALCVTAYVFVLWIELSPAFLERFERSKNARLARLAGGSRRGLEKILLFVLALGVLLPTMHQSSLGSLMLVAGSKLHTFWHTAWLPLLFLVSCVAMGYAVVVFESLLSSRGFRRPPETAILRSLGRVMAWLLIAFTAFRLVELAFSGALAEFALDRHGVLLILESLLALTPAWLILRGGRTSQARLFTAAVLMLLAGGLYRFSTYLLAFHPGESFSYFPAVPELLISLGLVAAEVAAYIAIVKTFPILAGSRSSPRPGVQGG